MRKFLSGLWKVITAPFHWLLWLLALPFRAFRNLCHFLIIEPEEHSLADVFTAAIQDKESRESLWHHIEALRKHLLRSVLAMLIAIGVSFVFTQRLVEFLARPVGGLGALRAIDVTESIGVFMRVALLTGLAIALPYITFEFWWFIAPGLKPRSRIFGLVGVPLALILFLSGMAFAYFLMFPTALPFLLNFMGVQAQLRPQSYFGFATGLMFWIGVSFEFPLVIYVLTAIGLLKPRILISQWRLAIVLIAVLAAVITPTVDPINMSLVMMPMILLYFIGIGLSFIAYAGRKKSLSQSA